MSGFGSEVLWRGPNTWAARPLLPGISLSLSGALSLRWMFELDWGNYSLRGAAEPEWGVFAGRAATTSPHCLCHHADHAFLRLLSMV